MSKIKLVVNKGTLISIAKKVSVLILIISNIVALGYMYRELSSLKTKLAATTPVQAAQPIVQNPEMDDLLADLTRRLGKLETGAQQLGQTLNACNVVSEAYSWVSPKSGYDTQLNNCTSNYKKLLKSL